MEPSPPKYQQGTGVRPSSAKFSKYRHFNTAVIFLSAITNNMIVQSLSSINQQITTYLPGVTNTEVSACALVFMLIHPCASVPVNYILDNYSLKVGISINAVMVLIGIFLRIFVLQNFAWVLAGNSIVAIGNAFLIYCPTKYSAIWYPPRDRILITSLIVFGNTVSGAFGAFLSPFFVKQRLNQQAGQEAIKKLMVFQFLLVGSVMMVNLLFFKGKPKGQERVQLLNSGNEQNVQRNESDSSEPLVKQPYSVVLRKLISDRQFILLFFASFLLLSSLNTLLVNIQLIIIPFGMNGKDAGSMAITILPFALVSSIITSKIAKRTKKYKKIILIEIIATFVFLLLALAGTWTNLNIFFWVAVIGIGVFGFPGISNILQYACQSLYPIGEATVAGYLVAGGQLASFVLGIAQTSLLQAKSKAHVRYTLSLNCLFLVFGGICFSLTKERLRRLQSHRAEGQKGQSTGNPQQQGHRQSLISQ